MRNKAGKTKEKQAGATAAVGQLLLPAIAGIARSKQALLEWAHQVRADRAGRSFRARRRKARRAQGQASGGAFELSPGFELERAAVRRTKDQASSSADARHFGR